MEKTRLEITFFAVLCILVLVLSYFVFKPFLSILTLAAVLSIIFRPTHKKLVHTYSKGKNLISFGFVLVALIFLILPILFFGVKILEQAQVLLNLLQNGHGEYMQSIQSNIQLAVRPLFPNFSFNISDFGTSVLGFISNNLAGFISQTAYILFQTFLLLFTFFFFLRDGDEISLSFISLSPFSKEKNEEIMKSIHGAITSVIKGSIFVGLIRWAIFAIGFYLFGIPNPMIWGSVAGIIGLIPGLGTPVALIPVIIYMALTKNIVGAIGLTLLGVLVSLFIDNILSAYFFGKGLKSPSIFVLFSILGGVMFFGPLGFIFGPIVLSLCISISTMYKIFVHQKIPHSSHTQS